MKFFYFVFSGVLFLSCPPTKISFKRPVDTTSRPIAFQLKRKYSFRPHGIKFSNQFDGARLNGVSQQNDSTYRLRFTPENSPINNSAYYAFDVLSNKKQNLYLQFSYPDTYTHRYVPKIYQNGVWNKALEEQIDTTQTHYQLKLPSLLYE